MSKRYVRMNRRAVILAALLILSLIPLTYAKPDDNPGKALGLERSAESNRNEEAPGLQKNVRIEEKERGAVKIGLTQLSPPDITVSDPKIKLIVNSPNGHIVATITGIMRGLEPSTEYMVHIADGQATVNAWSISGTWTRNVDFQGTIYTHLYTTTQSGSHYAGTGRKPATGTVEATESITGTVTGDHITFTTTYLTGDPPYVQTGEGEIEEDGSSSGTWTDNDGRSGSWASPPGSAVKVGTTAAVNYLAETVTFKTNKVGNANFHINLHSDDFASDGLHYITLQIKEGDNMILISDMIVLNPGGPGG